MQRDKHYYAVHELPGGDVLMMDGAMCETIRVNRPLLGCKLGDKLVRRKDGEMWVVKGINTLNGNLYLESARHYLATVTADTVSAWRLRGK
jgi:hypothetical protein